MVEFRKERGSHTQQELNALGAWLDTPAVCVDLDALDANLQRMASYAEEAKVKLRPHIKTHKSVWIAQEQLRYGACGITVAKLGEAEVMAEAGFDDILIAYPILGRLKERRLATLLEKANIIVSVDHLESASAMAGLGMALGRILPLYVDVNSGLNRCGKEPGEASAELALRIAELQGVKVAGLMTHGGHVYGKETEAEVRGVAKQEAESLLITQERLSNAGLGPLEISAGSTPTAPYCKEFPGITEIRPGAYVFGDVSQIMTHTTTIADCAMRIYATVVSKPSPGTVIIDAGSKTLTTDVNPHRSGYGLIPKLPEVVIERLSEEHGILRVADDSIMRIGDIVELIPNHCCTVTNLRDELVGMRNGRFERMIRVDARGKNQ